MKNIFSSFYNTDKNNENRLFYMRKHTYIEILMFWHSKILISFFSVNYFKQFDKCEETYFREALH